MQHGRVIYIEVNRHLIKNIYNGFIYTPYISFQCNTAELLIMGMNNFEKIIVKLRLIDIHSSNYLKVTFIITNKSHKSRGTLSKFKKTNKLGL